MATKPRASMGAWFRRTSSTTQLPDEAGVVAGGSPELQFGDQIVLFAIDQQGFVGSFVSSETYASVSVQRGSLTRPHIGNIKDCVFTVRATNKFQSAKNLRRAIAELRKPSEPPLSFDEALSRADQKTSAHLLQLKKLADSEEQDNVLEQKRRRGDTVHYGQTVLLEQALSGNYIRTSSSATSRLEPSNMFVDVTKAPTRHSWFRIMPRYKVRAEGDPVRMSDQVVFESVLTRGQFLHTSTEALPDWSPNSGKLEVNLSVAPSSFVIVEHLRTVAEVEDALYAGDVIQLHHKEVSGYVAAEGLYCEGTPRVDAHLRIRLPDPRRPSRQKPPTSSVSFWQVELAEAPTLGTPVRWAQPVRFKHVGLRQYLSISIGSNSSHVTSTPDDSTVFLMHAVLSDTDYVDLGSYIRVQHLQTGTWLHADMNSPLTRSFKPADHSGVDRDLAQRMSKIPWDGAELMNLSHTPQQMFDDAFIVTGVSSEQLSNLQFALGMVPVLLFYLTTRGQREITVHEGKAMARALEELKMFCFDRGVPVKSRQKLLRSLNLVDLMVDALQAPFKPRNSGPSGIDVPDVVTPAHAGTKLVCDAIYGVLKAYLDGDSRKNELFMAQHIPLFQIQTGAYLDVEKMYTELVRDNQKIVHAIGESQIRHFVEMLRENKNPDYLDFLSVLCECDGGPLGHNQELVANILLGDTKAGFVYLTELNEQKGYVEVSVSGQGNDWQPLPKFAESAMDENDSTSTAEFLFLQKQLHLFQKLCVGRNEFCIKMITQDLRYLTWKECFHCAQNDNLPRSLRAIYVSLMADLFIDVAPNFDILQGVQLAVPFAQLDGSPFAHAADDRTESLTGARMEHFPDLSDWLLKFLKGQTSVVVSDKPTNMLTAEVLSLLYKLVVLGYYVHPDDIKSIMKPLRGLVDGRNDRQMNKKSKKINFADDEAFAALEAQHEQEWQLDGRYKHSAYNLVVATVKERALSVIDVLLNLTFTIRLQLLMYDFKRVAQEQTTAILGAERRRSSRRSIAPVSTREGRHLSSSHREALTAMISAQTEEELLHYTPQIREYMEHLHSATDWVTPGWIPSARKAKSSALCHVLADLAHYEYPELLSAALRTMERVYMAPAKLMALAVNGQMLCTASSMEAMATANRLLPALRSLSTGYVEAYEIGEFLSITSQLTSLCMIDPEAGSQSPPNPVNQAILVNGGVIDVMFDILSQDGQAATALQAVFSLLRALAVDNADVQSRLFGQLDLLLSVQGQGDEFGEEQGLALAQIFTNNYRLCIAVKPVHIRKMVGLVAKRPLQSISVLEALRAVAKVEELNLPLMRNQALIVKHVMENREQIVAIAHIDDKSDPQVNAQRMRLLQDQMPDKTTEALQNYHCSLVAMFAACAEGENSFIESMCQTIFTVDELLEVLLDEFIPVTRKAAYMRFFLWVYLITGQTGVSEDVAQLSQDDRMARALKSIMGERVFEPNGPLSREATEFLFYSFLPFLSKIMRDFTPRTNLEFIVTRLGAFTNLALELIHDHGKLKILSETMIAAHEKAPQYVANSIMSKLGAKLQSGEAGLLNDPRIARFQTEHAQELTLNEQFNRFATNMLRSYGGHNTVRAQLPHAGAVETAEDQYAEVGGDEDLPLLPEFQAQVDLFAEYSTVSGKRVCTGLNRHVSTLIRQLQLAQLFGSSRDSALTAAQNVVDINNLQLLRAFIHNELKLGNDATVVQNQLAKEGAVLTVIQLLNNQNDLVVREALACLCALLHGGNKAGQAVLEDYFLETREEIFFDAVQARLRLSLDSVREMRTLRAQAAAQQEKDSQLSGTLTLASNLRKATTAALEEASGTDDSIEMTDLSQAVAATPSAKPKLDFTVQDEGNIELMLRMLSNIVEGHNLVLKGYLQSQPDNIRSIDLVTATVEFLRLLIEDVDLENIPIIIQTLETLVELAQGHEPNQRVIFDAKISDDLNFLLRLQQFPEGCDDFDVAHIKYACALLLAALLESNSDETVHTAADVLETIDTDAIKKTTADYMAIARSREDEQWFKPGDEGPPDAVAVAYACYTVLQRLEDLTGQSLVSSMPDAEESKAVEQSAAQSCSIEILAHGKLQKVYFRNKWRQRLQQKTKNELIWHVDRSSPANKIRDFVSKARTIIADMNHISSVTEWSPITRLMIRHSQAFDKLLLLVTFVIHVLIMISWSAPANRDELAPDFDNDWFETALPICGVVHLVLCVTVAINFFIERPPSINATLRSLPFLSSIIPEDDSTFQTQTSLLSMQSIYYLLLIGMSAAGLVTDGYFYCFHLFHVVVNNDILLRVIQSVTKNGASLLWVAALMIIVIYSYSFLVFAVLRDRVNPDRDSDLGGFCETALQCFVTSLKNGLLAGGGLGETLVPEQQVFSTFVARAVFDLSFFVLITVIGLNVVFGIIVDTFSELRDESYQIREAMENECFICSLKSYDFERFGKGFDHHVKHEHNMWDYLCFMIHLQEKPVTEYTALEAFVADMLKQGQDSAFFPINRALSLATNETKEVEEMLEMHSEMLRRISRRIEQLAPRNR